jgi:anti-sigma factor ChrR (cupin superfamily)
VSDKQQVERLVLSLLPNTLRESLKFEPTFPGVAFATLYRDGETGASAAVLRYDAGAKVPRHRHRGYEHIYVLEGSQRDEFGEYPAGTFVLNPPGTEHTVESPGGCLVLAVWQEQVEFIEAPVERGAVLPRGVPTK